MTNQPDHDNSPLLLGIKLGTARTAVVSSRGYRQLTPSVVGYPRDIIAIRLLGKTQVFGDQALAHKSALVLYHPLRDGLAADSGKSNYNAGSELLQQIISEARQGESGDISAVIAVPARTSPAARQTLQQMAAQFCRNALILPEPYLVAYHLNRLANCLLVDIGAGGVTVCAIKGSAPLPQDQAVLPRGGDYLDQQLQALVNQHHQGLHISLTQARQIKEQYGYVGAAPEQVQLTLRAKGKPGLYDLTDELGAVCGSIVPEVVEQLASLLPSFDPEDQETALQHIYLTGGGSRIRRLAGMIAEGMHEYGPVRVSCVDEPEYGGAEGALQLAAELPPADWQEFGLANRLPEAGS
ncbi:rod shape-determining protein [Desulfurivibrio alkaliphilus]|uniref:Actin/actin family protein n=1 Tax=Desulfurivibrio alkaliphilus (strain DSM 19089 / UNIQEM U267 / AHT2) TaxID=589865 RepID=D6Z0X5_DESAT|nr:rod shape-determining protein [Desulfurivibrio alkaliphilus]ADH87235.1 actin/actin family protein [Desulfurivibrio alkaliphilus AHT 2]